MLLGMNHQKNDINEEVVFSFVGNVAIDAALEIYSKYIEFGRPERMGFYLRMLSEVLGADGSEIGITVDLEYATYDHKIFSTEQSPIITRVDETVLASEDVIDLTPATPIKVLPIAQHGGFLKVSITGDSVAAAELNFEIYMVRGGRA
jgi:hypothetical protein